MGTSAAGENGTSGGDGSGPNDSGQNGTSGGTGSGTGTGTAGTGVPGSGIDREKLNPMLKGMNEEQINETFNTMMSALRQPAPAPRETAPRPAEKPPITNESLKDRFDPLSDKFDPKGAIAEIVGENYAPLITDIGRKANIGLKQNLRQALGSDFDAHEADLDKALENVHPNQINEGLMLQTYFAVVGAKATAERLKERAKPPTTRPPSTQRTENEVKLTQEEKDVAKVMFRNSENPEADYIKAREMMDSGYVMKVPGDK